MLRALILASLCAVISASIIPSYILDYPRSLQHLFSSKREISAENKKEEREVCKTKECELIAQVIKDSMDESLDPCEDFYEYACGKWSDVNQIPENMSDWSLWAMVSKKVERQVEGIIKSQPKPGDIFALKLAKKWYRSCMDTDAIERRGVEPILSTLWRHGGWPLIMEDGEWDDNVYNWQIVDDHFARLLGFNAFHDVRYSRFSYEDNDTLVIDTPHLPVGVYGLLPHEKYYNTDSSDENNESGEGSQEKGSKERGQEQQNSNSEDEETKEDEESKEDEGTKEDEDSEDEGGTKIAIARKHKRLGHSGSRNRKSKVTTSHIGKTRRRSRRDVLKRKVLHRKLHQLKKIKKHKIHRSTKGKLSQNTHLSHKKLSAKKHNVENRKIEKHSNAKVNYNKNNNKRKRIGKNDEEEKETQRKKKMERSKTAKRLGKHAHERKLKKKLNRIESGAKVHTSPHQSHQKITTNKLHHVNNKIGLNHKKTHLADSTENDINSSNDDDNEEDEDNNDASNNVDDEDEVENENDSDDNDGQESEEESDDNDENDDEDNEDDDKDDDEDSDNDNDDEEEVDLEEKRQEMMKAYREHILNVSIILSKGREIEISREQMMQDIDDLVEFTIKIGELTLVEANPMAMTLKELQEYYTELGSSNPKTKVNWVRKVEKLLAEAGIDIDNDVDVLVVSLEYIGKLHALLEETPSKVLVNYIHWLFISKAIMAGTEELWNLSNNWSGPYGFPPRESVCIEMVQMSKIAGYEYVKQYFSKDVAQSARDMIDDIQKEVEYQIKSSTWMDDDTKHFILDKLVHMKNWVGYPEWYQNTTLVKRYFRGLTVGPSFYENVLNYVRYARWKNLREMVDKEEDDMNNMMDPLELNAFFMPTENSISITAVDFQSPFFAQNRPWYVNFGIIGLVMGHEVNHGFDDSGHLYDKEGNQMEWLSAMAEAYNRRAECFVDQYNNYSILKGENYTIDNYGNQTIGENIADTMGLLAVFRAYKRRERECGKPDPALPGLEKFTNDQTFFLSFANLWCEATDREDTIRSAKYDVHSTGRLRIIGPASNSQDFAKAFNCPVGSPMNPKRKCDIWQ